MEVASIGTVDKSVYGHPQWTRRRSFAGTAGGRQSQVVREVGAATILFLSHMHLGDTEQSAWSDEFRMRGGSASSKRDACRYAHVLFALGAMKNAVHVRATGT